MRLRSRSGCASLTSGQVGSEHQHVDEKTDDVLELRAVPIRDGRADDDVCLAGALVKQRQECSHQGHERGRAVPA
jgi:hypothetical protein